LRDDEDVRFSRRTSVPPDVLGDLPLLPGERALAWAQDGQRQWYVGTDRALLLPEDGSWRRIGWERVERAEWDRDSGALVVVETAEFGTLEPTHRLRMNDPNRLLELVRERVTASVVVRRFVAVEGRRGITVVGRRVPHSDGALGWSFVVDSGLDESSPAVQAAAERALAQARAEIGV